MKIASPPIKYPDFYGIDTPEKAQLLASLKSEEEMAAYIGADSLSFLSVDGLYRAMGYKNGRDDTNPAFIILLGYLKHLNFPSATKTN